MTLETRVRAALDDAASSVRQSPPSPARKTSLILTSASEQSWNRYCTLQQGHCEQALEPMSDVPARLPFKVNAQADAWRKAEEGEEIRRVKSLVLEGTPTKCLVPPCLAVVDAHHAQHKLPAQPQRQWRLGVDDGLCTCREHGVGCQVSLGLADIAVLA